MGYILFILFALLIIINLIVIYYYVFPKHDMIDESQIPEAYFIEKSNKIDIQSKFECGAFSSAYVLRHFEIEADGRELYKNYPGKLPDGTISPKGILKYFMDQHYMASLYTGDIDTLKKRICKGVPVIVLVKVFPDKRYLHYVPVIGYDNNFLYLADSLKYTINCDEEIYNRKIYIKDFELIWKTWVPFYKNTYILINEEASI